MHPSTYTTYFDIDDQIKPLPGNSSSMDADKSVLVDYIWQASAMIAEWCGRTFVPYINANAKAKYRLSPYRVQELPDDALSVSTVTDTAGVGITVSTWRLLDVNENLFGYPYRFVEFNNVASFSNVDSNGFSPSFTFDGIWGYSTRSYASAWANTTTLNDDSVTDAVTSITVTTAINIAVLDYIRIDSEFMQVTEISTNTLTVKRGVNGSTAVAHDDSTQVDVWQHNDAVKLACTRLSAWLYASRQNEVQSVQFQDGTVAGINYPSIVKQSLSKFVKPHFVSVV